jgi:hypothetical protein
VGCIGSSGHSGSPRSTSASHCGTRFLSALIYVSLHFSNNNNNDNDDDDDTNKHTTMTIATNKCKDDDNNNHNNNENTLVS